jgi:hypothetical protein
MCPQKVFGVQKIQFPGQLLPPASLCQEKCSWAKKPNIALQLQESVKVDSPTTAADTQLLVN